MNVRKLSSVLPSMFAGLALLSCSANPPASTAGAVSIAGRAEGSELTAIYAELGAAGGKVFHLDPKSSAIRIYAFRGGRAPKLGHNHLLSAPRFTGYFYLPRSGPDSGRFDLEFRLDQLGLDSPDLRSGLGEAFASQFSPADVESTRAHMLGEDSLQSDRFPFVRIHSLQISGESPKFAAKMLVEMHGRKREMWIPLGVEGLPDRLFVNGSFVLRQTDFDVQPYSVLGGLFTMQDEVVIEFKLVGG
jgi:hypothetical protein